MTEGRAYFLAYSWQMGAVITSRKAEAMAIDNQRADYFTRYPERYRLKEGHEGVFIVHLDELERCDWNTLQRFTFAEKMMLEWAGRAESLQRSLR